MVRMEPDEPDDLDRRIARARAKYDRSHAELMTLIREALAAERGPSRIARHAGWTREYIAKIRDGKTGPKRQD
jgi:DNA-binding phage protein